MYLININRAVRKIFGEGTTSSNFNFHVRTPSVGRFRYFLKVQVDCNYKGNNLTNNNNFIIHFFTTIYNLHTYKYRCLEGIKGAHAQLRAFARAPLCIDFCVRLMIKRPKLCIYNTFCLYMSSYTCLQIFCS